MDGLDMPPTKSQFDTNAIWYTMHQYGKPCSISNCILLMIIQMFGLFIFRKKDNVISCESSRSQVKSF